MLDVIQEKFDKVYVINLKKHTDRRRYIEKHLAGMGLDYEFSEAVDGNKLSEEEILRVYDKAGTKNDISSKGSLSVAEIGCALSHIEIYKKAKREGFDHILVFEDDIVINKASHETIAAGLEELPPDWDIIYFGIREYGYNNLLKLKALSYYPLRSIFDSNFKTYPTKELLRFKPRKFSTHLELAGFHYGSHAYGISKRVMNEVIKNHIPLTTVFDCILPKICVSGEFNTFKFKKDVIGFKEEFVSSIQK